MSEDPGGGGARTLRRAPRVKRELVPVTIATNAGNKSSNSSDSVEPAAARYLAAAAAAQAKTEKRSAQEMQEIGHGTCRAWAFLVWLLLVVICASCD